MGTWVSTDSEAFSMLTAFAGAVYERGLDTPSLRAIATEGRCSVGTLRNWFHTKAELHRRVLYVLGVKWGHFLFRTLLPDDETGMFYARVRLAYEEVARTDPAVGQVLDDLVDLECEAVRRWLLYRRRIHHPDPRSVMLVHALLMRLWDVRAHPDRTAARLLLEQVLQALFGPALPADTPEPDCTRVHQSGWAFDDLHG